jgi:hypothetical protein
MMKTTPGQVHPGQLGSKGHSGAILQTFTTTYPKVPVKLGSSYSELGEYVAKAKKLLQEIGWHHACNGSYKADVTFFSTTS